MVQGGNVRFVFKKIKSTVLAPNVQRDGEKDEC
jgi:hypothetical protein